MFISVSSTPNSSWLSHFFSTVRIAPQRNRGRAKVGNLLLLTLPPPVVQVASPAVAGSVVAYAVLGTLPIPECSSSVPPTGCAFCAGWAACKGFEATAAAAGSGYVAACVGGRCQILLLGPILSPMPGFPDSNATYNPTFAVAAAGTPNGSTGILAVVNAPAGMQLRVDSFRPAAVCAPGSAGGAANAIGVIAGPRPGADITSSDGRNYTRFPMDAAAAANSSLFESLVLGGVCKTCSPGSSAQSYASGACVPCAPGTYQSAMGATQCSMCAAGTFQPQPGATTCIACDESTPTTLSSGAASASACFAATVGIDSAWVVGQSLSLSIYWSLLPLADAGVTDIVAVFFVYPSAASVLRQLAWTYTSVPNTNVDYAGGDGPGPGPVPRGSVTLLIPSAGEGLYAVRLFRNSTAPSISGLVPSGGGVIASALYYAAGGIPPPSPPNGANAMPLGAAVAQFPSDTGLSVDDGGLVCPAGTVTPYPPKENHPGGGG